MLRTFFWLLATVIILIIMLPLGLVLRLYQKLKGDKYADPPKPVIWICKNIVPLYVKLAGCDYTISGTENIPNTPVLFIGNHQGALDTLLILFAFGKPPIIMAKKETEKVPVAHLFMMLLNCIFIERKNPRKALACIKEAEDFLNHGNSVLIFPEGTRSRGPNMAEFKHGAFKAAIDAKVPIVPFALDGTYNVYEAQKHLKRAKTAFSILPMMEIKEGEKTAELSIRVQEAIETELERLRNE